MLNHINYQTAPGQELSFRIDASFGEPFKVEPSANGTVQLEGNFITFEPNVDFFGMEELSLTTLIGGQTVENKIRVNVGYPFKAKSHILSLLGDELIGSDNLAIFELVKNAYDADAEIVSVILNNLNTLKQSIIIEDNGNGMSVDTLINIWLAVGTDSKRGENRKVSSKYHRSSLGEKGVGRLAVHKLGRRIILETQIENDDFASRIEINWTELINNSNLIDETSVRIERAPRSVFHGKNHGTRIIIYDLKKQEWTRRDLRDLARKTSSIVNPFQTIKNFSVTMTANDYHQSWFENVKNPEDILKDSLYYFDFVIDESAICTWNYSFRPPSSFKMKHRASKNKPEESHLRINDTEGLFAEKQKHLKKEDLIGIGKIVGRFYVYNLSGPIIRAFDQTAAIKSFVKDNSGVRVFRDGIRIYNYGEPGDDWLGLDLARVQKLGERFSKNTVIGSVQIDMESSHGGLIEKTNREGFDYNITFRRFKFIINEIFDMFQREAQNDRELIKNYVENVVPTKKIGFSETIDELFEKVKQKNLEKELSPLLTRVRKDYNDMRDVMVNSGMAGMNLGIIFHEVDREVRFINSDLEQNQNIESVKTKVKNLIDLLENISPLLKQDKNITIAASQLVTRARDLNKSRFGFHNVIFSSPLISGESTDFNITGSGNLLLSAVSNLIDNSIYWVGARRELENSKFKAGMYIASDTSNFSGPAIIVADNGPGFNMEPEDLLFPFRTTRPGGMGLGLYFVNIVLEMIGGKVVFPDKDELNIPSVYDGAIVALVFPNSQN